MNFESLVGRIKLIQDALQAQAAHAVNLLLTARNWLVGYYIVEYEQHGEDRAKYGEKLINRLAESLNRRGFNPRRLRDYRHMYQVYPYLGKTICDYLQNHQNLISNSEDSSIWLFSIAKLQSVGNQEGGIWLSETAKLTTDVTQGDEKWRSLSAKLEDWSTPADKLFYRLNYTLLSYLATIEDPLKRAFYEQETIRGCWTQKELDRQVSSLYLERMGLSKDKEALRRYVTQKAQQLTPKDILHDPVTLEFLDMGSQDIYKETKLEAAILNNLQKFLLEMGNGFCFESRQKRILIDQDYHKADLIFYHRILKCHVIIDLKIDRFRHEYASQLNFYMNYYKHEVMQENDNPPIGLLLCTDYGETTIQYAIEGLSQNIFVSKYGIQLPSEDDLRKNMLEGITEEDFERMREA